MDKIRLVLASNSKWRKEIIEMAGLTCDQIPSSGDIAIPCENPDTYVQQLSLAKAKEVADSLQNRIVIAADTIGYLNGKVFEKPKDRKEAFQNLKELSGKVNYAVTGVTIIDTIKHKTVTFCEKVKVYFNEMSEKEINWYIDHEKNIYESAGYSLETCASLFTPKIEGDYKAIIGLPICRIFEELKKLGYSIEDFETPLDVSKPDYTKGEEIFNMTSHIVGVVLGIVMIVLASIFAAIHHNPLGVISGVIMGVTLVVLYTMSSIYHGLSPKLKAKKVFRVMDHCSIFLLIAGCATPFALCVFMQEGVALGWSIFGIIWFVAILGIVLNSISLKKFKVFSMICYLAMGWCFVVRADLLYRHLGVGGLALLVAGGVAYSVGAILYGIGKKRKWMHSIFHLFCILGSLLHVLCVLLYVV